MKHLKKDDGYVLVYVLIVFTILSFVAVSICGTALNNLQAQKATVARMEARYAAEGELQKVVAEIENLKTSVGTGANPTEDNKTAAKTAAKEAFWREIALENVNLLVERIEDTNKIQITAKAEKAGYIATIEAEAELTVATEFDEEDLEGTCSLAENGWSYTSYDISYEQKEVPDET